MDEYGQRTLSDKAAAVHVITIIKNYNKLQKELEHGCRMMCAGVPSFFWFGVGGRSC